MPASIFLDDFLREKMEKTETQFGTTIPTGEMSCHVSLTIPARASRAAKASQSQDACLCLVGGPPQLGGWDPKRSPQLAKAARNGCWEGTVDVVNEEFKFCVYNPTSHDYVWEEQGPLHRLPGAGQRLEAFFEDGGKDVKGAAAATTATTVGGAYGAAKVAPKAAPKAVPEELIA
eukprot:s201_g19.t1